jgi:hypothetical protein
MRLGRVLTTANLKSKKLTQSQHSVHHDYAS